MPQFKDVVTGYKPAIIFSDGEWEMTSDQWRSPELLAWLYNDSPVKRSGRMMIGGEATRDTSMVAIGSLSTHQV